MPGRLIILKASRGGGNRGLRLSWVELELGIIATDILLILPQAKASGETSWKKALMS